MYGHMTHWLSSLANGRVVLSLEGGYNVNSIAYAMTMCTKALLGDPLVQLEASLVPCPSAVGTIKSVIGVHEKYWPSLAFAKSLPQEAVLPAAKVPRAKPTERLAAGPSSFRRPEEPDALATLPGLERGLADLEIKECVNPGEGKRGGSNDPRESPSGSGSGADAGPAGSSQASGQTGTLLDYLQDNLQVGIADDDGEDGGENFNGSNRLFLLL